jgi:hypothetical protein
MLTQLNRLSLKTDGRYAKSSELQFLKNYLQSVELRVAIYEKIRQVEAEILSKAEAKIKAIDPKLFRNATGDYTDIWKRDAIQLIRYIAGAVILNEQDHLREGLLLWHKTLAKSFQFEKTCNKAFAVMQEIFKEYFTDEEMKLISPFLTLNQITLG